MAQKKKLYSIWAPSNNQSGLKKLLSQWFSRKGSLRDQLVDFFDDLGLSLSNDQTQMIERVVRLAGMAADKVKVPSNKMVSLPIDASLKEVGTVLKKSGHSRIPVYSENQGKREYRGLFYAKDIISVITNGERKFKLAKHLRKHHVVPETQTLLGLLRDMRLNKHHMALTVNEYGDVTGLVTLEDILEEIVGDIRDEFDSDRSPVREIGHRTYRVDASMPLTDINNKLMLNLPEEQFNTLSGFLLHETKGNPTSGHEVEYGDVIITIDRHQGQQIKTAYIQVAPTASNSPAGK